MIGDGPQKITVEIGGKIAASLGASLRGAQMQVSSFGRNVNRTMNDAATAGKKGFKNIFSNDLWQGAAAGAAGIGFALAGSVRVAASFENVLADIGKTVNASQGELKTLSGEILRLSGRNVTNLGPDELAQGVQDLVAQGLELKDAMASMEVLGKVATATNSDLLDVTKTGFQLQNALKIRPTELKATFDALAFAGKQGAFELKDMAQFMPTIAAAAGTLGITGKQGAISLAAMMQMVRKDAPDAGQAATRLTDAMLKMKTAPDVAKNFKKFGVDINKVLKDATKNGINPMEAALDQLQRVTGGDAAILGQIFGDKEAKLALLSLMKYRKEYAKLRDEAGGTIAAGTVDKDFQRSLDTFTGILKSFKSSSRRLEITLGNALLPSLTRIAKAITPLAEKFAAFAEKNPEITTRIVTLTGAFAGLVAIAPFVASVISIVGTIGAVASPIGIAVAAIIGIGAALTLAYSKVGWFRDLVNASWKAISTAFGGLINYLGGAWKFFTGIFTGDTKRIGEGFNQAIAGIKTMFGAWLGWMQALGPKVLAVFQRLGPAIVAGLTQVPALIIRSWQVIISGVRMIFGRVVAIIRETPQRVANVGTLVMQAIINGLKAKAGELFGWISNTWSRVQSMFSGATAAPPQPGGIAPVVNGIAPGPAQFNGAGAAGRSGGTYGGGQRSATPPGRASGGPVRAGFPYIVGERRRELFVPGMDGAIIPRVARPVSSAGAVIINAPITIHAGGGDAMDIRDQVRAAFEDLIARVYGDYRVTLND